MKTITITTYPSMPDRFRVVCVEPGKRDMARDAQDAGEAAAVALNYATGSYVIVGIGSALGMIPQELRHKSS